MWTPTSKPPQGMVICVACALHCSCCLWTLSFVSYVRMLKWAIKNVTMTHLRWYTGRKEIANFSMEGPQATELAHNVLGTMSSKGSIESDYGLAAPPSRRLSGTISPGLRSRGNSTGQLAKEVNLISLDDDPAHSDPAMALQPYGAPVPQQQYQQSMVL